MCVKAFERRGRFLLQQCCCHQRFLVTGPLNDSWGNSSSRLWIGLPVLCLGSQQLRVKKGSVFGGRIFHPVTFVLPWWTFTGCADGAAPQASSSSSFLKKEANVRQLQTFSGMSGQTAAPLVSSHCLNLKRHSHFSGTPLEIVKVAAAPHHVIAMLLKLPITIPSWRSCPSHPVTHTDSLCRSRREGNHPKIHFLIITISPQCLLLLWKPWLHQKLTKSTFYALWSADPLRLALILSRALRNVSLLSGLNMTKPMSLETSIFMFIVPLCHVLQQKYIYPHQSL